MRASRPFGSGSGKSFKSGRLLLAADAAALSQKEQYEEEPNESSDVEARRPRRWIRFAGWQVGRAVWGAEPDGAQTGRGFPPSEPRADARADGAQDGRGGLSL